MMAAAASARVVQYGRRKAQRGGQPAEKHTDEVSAELVMSKPIDLRQVRVLPKAEWERIQNNMNTLEKEAKKIYEEKKERETMYLHSKEVVKHWTNTIPGLRQKKLKAKQLREEKEEEEKQRIDIEEAKFQAEERREAIEKAKTKQYYHNDKVKNFHSALLLTEVMKEREAQIELKKKKMNLSDRQEKDGASKMQQEREESIFNDQKKALQRVTDRKNNAKDLLKQMEEHIHTAEVENIANQREGEEIRRLTRLYEWEMDKLAKMKIDEKREIMMAHLAHVADRDFLRALEKQKQEADDDMIRLFILAKRKVAHLKKEKEEAIHRQTQEYRDKITDLLAEQMKQKMDNEDQCIAKAAANSEAKSIQESQEKEEKMKADIKAITEHRLAMRRRREDEEKEEKFKAIQALHDIKEADNFFIAQQKDKMGRVEKENKKMQTILIQQMAARKTGSLLEKEAEQDYAKQNETLLAKEEEHFQEYAKEVIDSVTKARRNPYPLKKAAQSGTGGGHGPVYSRRGGIRPSYLVQDTSGVQLPAYQNDTTQHVKEIYDTGDIQHAKRRLGFTW
ncbi:cilia- and flagella- associated protein 210 [Ascaphus truei]|uniref:cilia- and flagella- associated protein 210 n=1 Tax=Ascaphus truei TaxID=8439 RepID=UPI003F594128